MEDKDIKDKNTINKSLQEKEIAEKSTDEQITGTGRNSFIKSTWLMVSVITLAVVLSFLLYYFSTRNSLSEQSSFDDVSAGQNQTENINAGSDSEKDISTGLNSSVEGPILTISDVGVIILRNGISVKQESTIDGQPDNEEVDAGDILSFTVTIQNSGKENSGELKIINYLPAGGKLEVLAPDISDPGIYEKADQKIVWDIKNLAPGVSTTVSFNAVVSDQFEDQEKFENKTEILSGERILAEKTIEKKVNVYANLTKSEIILEDKNGGEIWATDRLKYTIIVRNTGERATGPVEIVCKVPAGMGYLPGSASTAGLFADEKNNLLKWKFSNIGPGDVRKLTFETFIADFLTHAEEIKTDFYIQNAGSKIELENPAVNVSAEVFENIVCMGDSLVALTDYPVLLDELLEKEFPHAEFNVIASAVKGEMANNAIVRFDSDIRLYNPDAIIIGYGANDAGEETGLYRYFMDILVRKAVSTGAKVFVYGVGHIDTTIPKWEKKDNYTVLNTILKNDICPKNGAVYIDLYSEMSKEPQKYIKSDGMHWNEDGTELVVNLMIRTLVKYMDKNGKILK